MKPRRTIAVAARLETAAPVQQEPVRARALQELAGLDQWVISGHDKAPQRMNDRADRLIGASHSEPSHWTSHAAARAAATQFEAAGVGFVFSEYDPYTFVDFDGCRDVETGAIAPWAQRWITALNSFTEISRSGAGCHTFVRGTLPKTLIHSLGAHKGIEVYSQKRYCALTGNHLPGTPETINEAQPILDAMLAEFSPPKPKAEPKPIRKVSPGELGAERATLADVREKFNAEHDLDELLTNYGAVETRYGYECPCGVAHANSNTLFISREGRLFSRSPQCNWYTTKGWDAFGLYVKVEHNDNVVSALKALNPIEPKASTPRVCPDYLTSAAAAKRTRDRERRQAERTAARAERISRIEPLRTQVDQDEKIYPFAHDVFAFHLACWADNPEHYASLEKITRHVLNRTTAPSESDIRRVQLAHQRLIERGYLVRTIRFTPGAAETNCWQPGDGYMVIPTAESTEAQQNAENETRITIRDHESDLIFNPYGTCEPPPLPPPDENAYAPASLVDEWECSEAPIGDDVLIWLAEQDVIRPVEAPQVEPPAIVFVSTPDARGMCLVRWSDGKVTWRKETSRELEKQPAADNTGGGGSGAGERTPVQPAIASTVERPGECTAAAGRVEPQGGAEAEASYNVAADWTAPKSGRKLPKPPKIKALAANRKRQERWRDTDIPELRHEMYSLRGLANKRSTPVRQRDTLLDMARDLEYIIAVKEAARGVPVEPDDGLGDGGAVQARALTSSRGIATEQAVFAGV